MDANEMEEIIKTLLSDIIDAVAPAPTAHVSTLSEKNIVVLTISGSRFLISIKELEK